MAGKVPYPDGGRGASIINRSYQGCAACDQVAAFISGVARKILSYIAVQHLACA
jgi:hypothetical protein